MIPPHVPLGCPGSSEDRQPQPRRCPLPVPTCEGCLSGPRPVPELATPSCQLLPPCPKLQPGGPLAAWAGLPGACHQPSGHGRALCPLGLSLDGRLAVGLPPCQPGNGQEGEGCLGSLLKWSTQLFVCWGQDCLRAGRVCPHRVVCEMLVGPVGGQH